LLKLIYIIEEFSSIPGVNTQTSGMVREQIRDMGKMWERKKGWEHHHIRWRHDKSKVEEGRERG